VPSLRGARIVHAVERSWRTARERGRFRLVHYSLQRDHVHLIVEAASASDLACGMKSIGARLARAVNRVLGRKGQVLADRFHAHILRTPQEVPSAIAYVLLNARRHAWKAGRWIDPRTRVDPASSGRWFSGWRSFPPKPHDPPAVARPRTWLLEVGWRRHGLVRLDEVPGGRSSAGSGAS
jgi:REP element-mobilizing transposase RayT